MSEFRQNHATKEWVIIAPERASRPHGTDHVITSENSRSMRGADCPFCVGNEAATGEERLRDAEGGVWRVRCVANKFSPFDNENPIHRKSSGRFLSATSSGIADIVIETPRHDQDLPDLSPPHLAAVLRMYRERSIQMALNPDTAIVMIFKNHGKGAGGSQVHAHSQMIASPIVPPHVRDPFQRVVHHYDTHGTCVYCDMIEEEIHQGLRVVAQNDFFVAICPFASRTPYEIRIYPILHRASFVLTTDVQLASLADILHTVLSKMRDLLHDPDFNYIIRSAPVGDEDVRSLHWYLVLIPKVTTPAGFEIGSGIYINPSSPEQCAAELKEREVG